MEASAPTNPFCTAQYQEARATSGELPVVLSATGLDGDHASFYGFLRARRVGNRLDIPSIPAIIRPDYFAKSIVGFCAAHNVTELELNSYASPATSIPRLIGETRRISRTEYVIDLDGEQLLGSMSKGHKYDVKRAQKVGLTLRRSVAESACADHARLMSASMARRQGRGETVPPDAEVASLMTWLRSGAGELFQVVNGETVVSSMLLLRARLGAYDHSAGSNAEGMSTGAAKLLMYLACVELRAEGSTVLNLGGVREHEKGMRAFKENFGARAVKLEAVTADFTRPLDRIAHSAARLVMQGLRALRRRSSET